MVTNRLHDCSWRVRLFAAGLCPVSALNVFPRLSENPRIRIDFPHPRVG
jgi:hypothetical protein